MVLDGLAASDAREEIGQLVSALGRHDDRHVAPHGLVGGIAVESFGGGVPGGDGAIQRLADDGIVGRFDDGGQVPRGLVIFPTGDRAPVADGRLVAHAAPGSCVSQRPQAPSGGRGRGTPPPLLSPRFGYPNDAHTIPRALTSRIARPRSATTTESPSLPRPAWAPRAEETLAALGCSRSTMSCRPVHVDQRVAPACPTWRLLR